MKQMFLSLKCQAQTKLKKKCYILISKATLTCKPFKMALNLITVFRGMTLNVLM